MQKFTSKVIGAKGEKIAIEYLQKKKFSIVECNFSCPYGEIDIIATDKISIYFFEVKYRRNEAFGLGEQAISTSKLRRLKKTIEIWVSKHLDLVLGKDLYVNALIIDSNNDVLEFEVL